MLPLTEIKATEFNVKRELFLGKSATLILLREDGSTAAFSEVATVQAGWNPEFSDKFGNTTFHVADATIEFAGVVRKATHLVVTGSGLATLNDVIHETMAETSAPDAKKPWWRIRAKSVGRKYVSSAEI